MSLSCWSWFLAFAWVWCLPLMLVAAEEQQGDGCLAKCGSVTISPPFWLTDWQTGRLCGSSGRLDFELTCYNGSYPLLPSFVPNRRGFAIMDISYEERSLRVVDLDKLQLLHDASNNCLPIWNTSVIFGLPFKISPVNLELILYNCTEKAAAAARLDKELVQAKTMRYVNTSNTFVHAGVPYDPTGTYSSYALEGCVPIVLPVLRLPSGETNTSHYERLIQSGFLLKWELPPPLPAPAPRNEPPPPPGHAVLLPRIVSRMLAPMFTTADGPGENRCAHFSLQVHCSTDGVPYLGYYNRGYRLQIHEIFYINHSLLVSEIDKLIYLARRHCFFFVFGTLDHAGSERRAKKIILI
ncbi:uncharacterized protein LOC125527500, partial [Triticum urartu]|uniref:uncharacterized protein LOC125527500 n=1 Tax=Triticum urartu TaxID=4572 RepID=UPI0020441B2A